MADIQRDRANRYSDEKKGCDDGGDRVTSPKSKTAEDGRDKGQFSLKSQALGWPCCCLHFSFITMTFQGGSYFKAT